MLFSLFYYHVQRIYMVYIEYFQSWNVKLCCLIMRSWLFHPIRSATQLYVTINNNNNNNSLFRIKYICGILQFHIQGKFFFT